jgi:uncharacterized protein YrrD
LQKAYDLIGLPILAVDSGKHLGKAKDMLIDENWKIKGIMLDTRHWFTSIRYIEGADIIACGEDAITIPNERAIRNLDQNPSLIAFQSGNRKLKGLPVITVSGQKLGVLEDVYFESNLGKQIVGYELSEGFISDIKDGRKWLAVPDQAIRGEDAIIVPVHCNLDIEEEPFVSKEE